MKIVFISMVLSAFMLTILSAADNQAQKKMGPSMQQRQKMAEVHEKMADCLRSEKSIDECHKNMRNHCELIMGANGCPMMKKMHGGMKDQGGMQDAEEKK